MKFLHTSLLVALLFHLPLSGEDAATEKKLSRALKLFPDADANKDGTLTKEEALLYLEAHPELKAFLNSSGGNPAALPDLSTPPSSELLPGPRIFVCAHSFMIYTASLLPPMAEAAGFAYRDAGRQMIGGSRVIQHWDLPEEKNRAKAALSDGRVDLLTLSPHVILPDEGIDQFVKFGLEKNPKLRVYIQASWPARDGVLESGFTNEQRNETTLESLQTMHEMFHSTWLTSLEAQVNSLNASVGQEAVFIVPVCDAVIALRKHIVEGTAPGLTKQTDLFRDPLGHPLPPLATLVTYCHFSCLFQRSPVGLPVPKELASTPEANKLNTLLQQLAWQAVTAYPLSGVKAEAPATAILP